MIEEAHLTLAAYKTRYSLGLFNKIWKDEVSSSILREAESPISPIPAESHELLLNQHGGTHVNAVKWLIVADFGPITTSLEGIV